MAYIECIQFSPFNWKFEERNIVGIRIKNMNVNNTGSDRLVSNDGIDKNGNSACDEVQ